MAVTLDGKMYAQRVKSEGLRFAFVHASSAMGVWQPIRHPSRLQCPFFLRVSQGLHQPMQTSLVGSTPCALALGTCLSGVCPTAGRCPLCGSKVSLSSACLCCLYSARHREARHVCLFNKIMDFQGRAQTLLVARDRNSNSLSQRRK